MNRLTWKAFCDVLKCNWNNLNELKLKEPQKYGHISCSEIWTRLVQFAQPIWNQASKNPQNKLDAGRFLHLIKLGVQCGKQLLDENDEIVRIRKPNQLVQTRETKKKFYANYWCCYISLNPFMLINLKASNWDDYNIYYQRQEAFSGRMPPTFQII